MALLLFFLSAYWFDLFPKRCVVVLLAGGQVFYRYLNFQKMYTRFQGDYVIPLFTKGSFQSYLFLRNRIDVNRTALNLPH